MRTDPFRLEDPSVGQADRAAMRAETTGQQQQLTPAQFRRRAVRIWLTVELLKTEVRGLTDDQVLEVRSLRIIQGYSFAAVAEACALEWQLQWTGGLTNARLAGIALCMVAAERAGECFLHGPWQR